MLIHGRAEFVVRGRRIDDGIKEALGITLVESHRFVLLDGLLSIFQGTGHNEAADGFPFKRSCLFDPPASPFR